MWRAVQVRSKGLLIGARATRLHCAEGRQDEEDLSAYIRWKDAALLDGLKGEVTDTMQSTGMPVRSQRRKVDGHQGTGQETSLAWPSAKV